MNDISCVQRLANDRFIVLNKILIDFFDHNPIAAALFLFLKDNHTVEGQPQRHTLPELQDGVFNMGARHCINKAMKTLIEKSIVTRTRRDIFFHLKNVPDALL